MEPTVGRIVHYVSYGTPVREDGSQEYTPECRAAIITATCTDPIEDDAVSLAVLNPSGMFFNQSVAHSETAHEGGSWHWPERA